MTRIYNNDLVLHPSRHVDPQIWDEGEYDAFVDELCRGREYQKMAIFTALRYLLGGKYDNLRALAQENYDTKPKMQEAYGSWEAMESRLPFPDMLSCSLDLATGTGKSYVLYALAAIMMAKGAVDRALVLCPSRTIERGLIGKFSQLAAADTLRDLMPGGYAPRIIDASETVTEGCICVENYHAILEHTGASIRDSFVGNGGRTLVLNDEAHHVNNASPTKSGKWREFLQDDKFGFRRIVGVSGTCYVDGDYFADVISRYSLREAIEERVVKNVEYVAESPNVPDPDEKWQLIYQRHKNSIRQLRRLGIRPLTIVVTHTIQGCDAVAEELCAFLQGQEGISEEQAKEKVMIVTSSPKHQRDVARLGTVDNPQSKTEWIVSVSMLTEGWDVKNVFQIVPHEERAFHSKLLISQVLGRGLRIPESWQNGQPVVTVFNHANWSGSIKRLVDEILDIEQRVSSRVIAESQYHFDLHALDYDITREVSHHPMQGRYNMFKEGFIDLPTVDAEEKVKIEFRQVRGSGRTEEMTIRHKYYTVTEIARHMREHLLAIDKETAANEKHKTNYAKRFSLRRLEDIVRKSVRRAKINEKKIPDEIRQKCMAAMNVLKRKVSKRVAYRTEAISMSILNTADRQAASCSATDLHNHKTVFCRSDCANFLPQEQRDFFNKLADRDGDFAGRVEIMSNNYLFKSPVNLAIADHNPERRFIRELCEPPIAAAISGWIKNTDMGFYAVEYAWSKERIRRVSHIKRGMFSPDFFIKAGNGNIYVVEIKGDEEINDPSRENIAKYNYAKKHFALLSEWLAKTGGAHPRYQFNMLTLKDYDAYFSHLRENDLDGYVSRLDAAIAQKSKSNGE